MLNQVRIGLVIIFCFTILEGMTWEFAIRVVDENNEPLIKRVRLYKIDSLTYPYRDGDTYAFTASGFYTDCNGVFDVGISDNTTNPPMPKLLEPIENDVYYIRIDNKYCELHWTPADNGDIGVKFDGDDFTILGNTCTGFYIGTTANWSWSTVDQKNSNNESIGLVEYYPDDGTEIVWDSDLTPFVLQWQS